MTDIQNAAVIKPSYKVLYDSVGAHHQILNVESGTTVYPGGLVCTGTDDDDIVTCGLAGKAIGWAGYEDTPKKYRPATIDTLYSTLDRIDVVNGPGIIVRGRLQSGQNVDRGTRLIAGAAGELVAASAAAPPSGSVACVSTGAQPTAAGPLSSQGIPVGYAYESVDSSSGALPILVVSLI